MKTMSCRSNFKIWVDRKIHFLLLAFILSKSIFFDLMTHSTRGLLLHGRKALLWFNSTLLNITDFLTTNLTISHTSDHLCHDCSKQFYFSLGNKFLRLDSIKFHEHCQSFLELVFYSIYRWHYWHWSHHIIMLHRHAWIKTLILNFLSSQER